MHQTTIKNHISLVRIDGEIIFTFSNFDSVVEHWPILRGMDIGKSFKTDHNDEQKFIMMFNARRYGRPTPKFHHDYILRNSLGDILDPVDVAKAYKDKYPRKYRTYNSWRKRANGHFFRHPHTTQERRWAGAWNDDEVPVKVRSCRSARNLPSSWDDGLRTCWGDKCWKRYRKHQWRG
jgi:hypothetical protein